MSVFGQRRSILAGRLITESTWSAWWWFHEVSSRMNELQCFGWQLKSMGIVWTSECKARTTILRSAFFLTADKMHEILYSAPILESFSNAFVCRRLKCMSVWTRAGTLKGSHWPLCHLWNLWSSIYLTGIQSASVLCTGWPKKCNIQILSWNLF